MNGIHLPDELPESMVGPLCSGEGVVVKLRDSERISRRHDECGVRMKQTLGFLEQEVLPLVKSRP